MKIFILILLLFPSIGFSQTSFSDNLTQDLANVGIAAVIGTVLGISTLAFTDKPLDNYNNIITGGALGILVGVGVVAYYRSKDEYFFLNPSPNQFYISYIRKF